VRSRIKKLEAEILKLEGKPATRSEKAPLKRKPKKTGMTTIKTKGKTPAAGSTRGATVAPAKN